MKRIIYLALGFVLTAGVFASCDDDTDDPITPGTDTTTPEDPAATDDTGKTDDTGTEEPVVIPTYKVSAKITSPIDVDFTSLIVTVSQDTSLTLTADGEGAFEARLNEGKFNINISGKTSANGKAYSLSGEITDLDINADYDTTQVLEIPLSQTETNQIIITEVYCSNSTYYDETDEKDVTLQKDKYIKLYNNSDQPAEIKNLCFGLCFPYMSSTTTQNHFAEYSAEGWTPATQGIWYIDEIKFEPYEEKVFVVYSAEDYTSVQGVNLDHPGYYCLIDMASAFNIASYYTEPSADKTKLNVATYAQGTAWQIGNCPALFIFTTGEVSPADFANDAANQIQIQGGAWGALGSSLKVQNKDIIDGVDIKNSTCSYNAKTGALTSDNSTKYGQRLPDAVDKGFVNETETGQGFSYYRNVDKEATEALPENEGKLTYGYNLGTETLTNGEGTASGSTDPSGIDAQASIKNGAHIIYKDTDNSSEDFHQRKQPTLKD